MSGFSELIKNFEKTRDFVRDFFINGFKTRSEFDKKSARTYDNEKRRVESWLGDDLRYNDSVRGRMISISVDSRRVSENPLYRAFYSKSFTDNDIRLHFMLLDVLRNGEKLPLKELTDMLNERYEALFDEQTVRNKLKEYAEEGLITVEKQGRTALFSLSEDRVDEYLDAFPGLSDAVKFFSESGEFGVVGNSILKSERLENDLFLKKHNYIVHTLEDAVLPEILRAIGEKRFVLFKSYASKRDPKVEKDCRVLPMQISASAQTGRRYLMAYLPALSRFNSYRLDRIRAVKLGEPCEEFDKIHEKYLRNVQKSWGVSFGERREEGQTQPLKITIAVGKNEGYIVERLNREKRVGTLEKLSEERYRITLDVFDTTEPLPWIKTFIGRIAGIEGGSENARKTLLDDIWRMDKMYNGEKNDDIQ